MINTIPDTPVLSEYIAARRLQRQAFSVAQSGHKCYVVGAYSIGPGNPMRYTDPQYIGPRDKCAHRERRPTKCLYRVIVTPKPKG